MKKVNKNYTSKNRNRNKSQNYETFVEESESSNDYYIKTIKNKNDLETVLRKFFYKRYSIYEKCSNWDFLVIFHVKWYEFKVKSKIKKAISEIINMLSVDLYIEFCYEILIK